MRAIFGISCLLLGMAMLSCQMESFGERAQTVSDVRSYVEWVRTADGWERPDNWYLEPQQAAALHPLIVAAGQTLFSIFALVVFSRDERQPPCTG